MERIKLPPGFAKRKQRSTSGGEVDHGGEHSVKTDDGAPKQHETVDAAEFDRVLKLAAQESIVRKPVARSGVETAGAAQLKGEHENAALAVSTAAETASASLAITAAETSGSNTQSSLERELLEFQAAEAQNLLLAEDWETAEEVISDVLESTSLSPEQRLAWLLDGAEVLQMQGRWQESLDMLQSTLSIATYGGRALFNMAEAHYQLRKTGDAKMTCIRALRLLEAERDETQSDKVHSRLNNCIELMARIAEARGKKVDAKFYRSKTVEGFVSKAHKLELGRKDQTAEGEAGVETMKSVEMAQHDEMLELFGLKIKSFNFDDIDGPCEIAGTDSSFFEDFREALKPSEKSRFGNYASKALDLFLRDSKIRERQNTRGYHENALYYAIVEDNAHATEALLRIRATVEGIDLENLYSSRCPPRTSLGIAARHGSVAAAKTILASPECPKYGISHPDDPRLKQSSRSGFVYQAIAGGNPKLLGLLVSYQVNVNLWYDQDDYYRFGCTPLHHAIILDEFEMVKVLLEAGASVKSLTETQMFNPVHLAIRARSPRILQLVVQRGADTVGRCYDSNTPMSTVKGARDINSNDKSIYYLILEGRDPPPGTDLTLKEDPMCLHCHRTRQKSCIPDHRRWPGVVCDRCAIMALPCSEPMTASRYSSQIF